MVEEIREAIKVLNDKLSGTFPYRLEVVNPKDIKLLDKNARYMKAETFKGLVENVKQDGNLSSMPLCYEEADGKLLVLSGNHRIMAAKKAGVEMVMVMVIASAKTNDERIAIQLSHNAHAGQDDMVILKELWDSIGNLEARLYAGLDSDTLKIFDTIQFQSISEARLNYKATTIFFLPEEVDQITAQLDQINIALQGDTVYLAAVNDYEKFLGVMKKIKRKMQIKNNAATFLKLVEFAKDGLDRYLEEQAAAEQEV